MSTFQTILLIVGAGVAILVFVFQYFFSYRHELKVRNAFAPRSKDILLYKRNWQAPSSVSAELDDPLADEVGDVPPVLGRASAPRNSLPLPTSDRQEQPLKASRGQEGLGIRAPHPPIADLQEVAKALPPVAPAVVQTPVPEPPVMRPAAPPENDEALAAQSIPPQSIPPLNTSMPGLPRRAPDHAMPPKASPPAAGPQSGWRGQPEAAEPGRFVRPPSPPSPPSPPPPQQTAEHQSGRASTALPATHGSTTSLPFVKTGSGADEDRGDNPNLDLLLENTDPLLPPLRPMALQPVTRQREMPSPPLRPLPPLPDLPPSPPLQAMPSTPERHAPPTAVTGRTTVELPPPPPPPPLPVPSQEMEQSQSQDDALAPPPQAQREAGPVPKEQPTKEASGPFSEKAFNAVKAVKRYLLPEEKQALPPAEEGAAGEQEDEPVKSVELLDELIDCVAYMSFSRPVKGSRIAAYTLRPIGRKVTVVEGLYDNGQWGLIESEQGYTQLRFAVPVANNYSQLNEIEFLEWVFSLRQVVKGLGGQLNLPSLVDVYARSKQWFGFINQHNHSLVLNLLPDVGQRYPWQFDKLAAVCNDAGFTALSSHVYRAEVEGGHFEIRFNDRGRDGMVTGLSLWQSITLNKDPVAVFDALLEKAQILVTVLGGALVDDNRRPLLSQHFDYIRSQIKARCAEMAAAGVVPGSVRAQRLFS